MTSSSLLSRSRSSRFRPNMTMTTKSKTNGLHSLPNLTRSPISKMKSLHIFPGINRSPISKAMMLELPINFLIYFSKNMMPCKKISMIYAGLRIIQTLLTLRTLIWIQVASIGAGLQSMVSFQDALPHDLYVEVLCWQSTEFVSSS